MTPGTRFKMRIDVLTLFPEMFLGFATTSILKRAIEKGLVNVRLHNFRDFACDKHHTVDDCPYGGGAGMVLKPEPIFEALEAVRSEVNAEDGAMESPIILLTPQGRLFSQEIARELAQSRHLVLLCGHYEGVDERIRANMVSDEISIGDYVLSGGEPAAMVVIDATIRLIPGVLGSEESALDESHAAGLLEYPQYTRPEDFRGWSVPEILLSGNHAQIAKPSGALWSAVPI
jgi:tRNA (guanine37-N1)-methyltransferase